MSNVLLTRKRRKAKGRKRILAGMGIALLLMILPCWLGLHMLVAAQDVSLLDKPLPAATVLYDEEGREAVAISLNEIEPVTFDQLPKHLIDAIVAVEDRRFFEHRGTDMWGVGRALLRNVAAGHTVQGGSTITQQLAKNVFLTHERTWRRKWNEVLLAGKIEKQYSKDEIITMYLNQIYFGEGAWGIKRAADVYFGKPVERLSAAQSALLAGLVKAPSVLSPYKRPEQAIERRNTVLKLMKDQGLLEEEAYDSALKEKLSLRESKPNRTNTIQFPYYTDQVIREAVEEFGLSENDVLHGGFRIYTTLSPAMQKAAEHIYEEDSLFPASMGDEPVQSAAVLVDPRTGGIKALVGGRGAQPFRGFNRAVQMRRQPGSTMKPIAVYTPALENGYRTDSTIMDEPVQFGSYAPNNAGGQFHGEVSLYEALIHSYNIPAVKVLNAIGIERGVEAANRFGIPLAPEDENLGLALGGLHTGASPLHMAEAFGTFANDGIRMDSHAIVRIESADGTVIASRSSEAEQGTRVTSEEIARTMNAMLMGVVEQGTGQAAAIEGRQVAGKTGTTEMPGTAGEGAMDNWFVGYTPQLAGAVWLGYDNPKTGYLTTTSKAAAAVFQALMSEALDGQPAKRFPAAHGLKISKAAAGQEGNRGHSTEKEHKGKEADKERKKEKDKDRSRDKDEDRGRDREKNSEEGKRDKDKGRDSD